MVTKFKQRKPRERIRENILTITFNVFCVKWMSSRELLCLTVKLQSGIKRVYYSVASLSN